MTEKKDALQLTDAREHTGMSYATKKQFAIAAFHSGITKLRGRDPRAAIAEALVKIQYGEELGVGPMTALQHMHVIDGKVVWEAHLAAAKIQESGRFRYRVLENTEQRCIIEFFELVGLGGWESLGSAMWTIDDAKRAKLTTKDNWQKYPKAMLYSRTLMSGARMFCPAIFHGSVYSADEITSGEATIDSQLVEQAEKDAPREAPVDPDVLDADFEEPAAQPEKQPARRTKPITLADCYLAATRASNAEGWNLAEKMGERLEADDQFRLGVFINQLANRADKEPRDTGLEPAELAVADEVWKEGWNMAAPLSTEPGAPIDGGEDTAGGPS